MALNVIFAEYRLGMGKLKQDASQLSTTVKKTQKDVVDSANQGTKAFEKEAAAANKVASAQKNIQSETKKTSSSFSDMKGGVMQLGAAMGVAFGIQQVVQFGKASAEAFIDAQKNAQLLLFALKGNEAAQGRLMAQAARIQENTIFDDDSIQQAQTFLATQGRTEAQISKVIDAAVELSTVTGVDLQTAVMQLDGTFEGNIGKLGKLDAAFKKLTPEQLANGAAADLLIQKYKGTAEAMGDTAAGKVAKLKNQFGELQETIGEKMLPAIEFYSSALEALNEQDIGKFFEALNKNMFDQTKQLFGVLEGLGIISEKYVDTLTDREKAELKIIASTEDELALERERVKAIGGNIEEFDRYVKSVRESQIKQTFEELAKVLQITEDQYKRLTDISDKYNASARISADLIIGIKDATEQDLEVAFQKFNTTLGVTRKDFDDYIGRVKQIKPLQEDLGKSTQAMVGPWDSLNQSLSKVNKLMYDYLTIGKDAMLQDRERFELQKKINKVQEDYNYLLGLHNPIVRDNTEVNKAASEGMDRLAMATTSTLEPTRLLPFNLEQITEASKDSTKSIEDLEREFLDVAKLAGALAELGESLSNALTQIFGEAAEKNAIFAAFQKAITISTITFKSIEAVANGVAAFSAGVSSGDPVKIIGGISAIVSGIGSLIGGLIQQVQSTPVPSAPSFFEGTDYVQRGQNPKGKDTIPAYLNEGEGVVTTAKNAQYPGLVKSINSGNFEEYALNFAAPFFKNQDVGGMAIPMYDDAKMRDLSKSSNGLLRQQNGILKKMLTQHKNPWSC